MTFRSPSREVVVMAFDTVRTNKMRSGLTVLGVVIGITSIVGMTAMIRGFDQSLREPDPRRSGRTRSSSSDSASPASPTAMSSTTLLKRPNLTISDARALEEQATSMQTVDVAAGRRRSGPPTQQRVFYRDLEDQAAHGLRHDRALRRRHQHPDARRPVLQRHRSAVPEECRRARQHRRTSCCSSRPAPIRSARWCASAPSGSKSSACSTSGRRPAASTPARTISWSSRTPRYQRHVRSPRRSACGAQRGRIMPIRSPSCRARACRSRGAWPRSSGSCGSGTASSSTSRTTSTSRRRTRSCKLWDRISQATFFALVVISSIALMVGGIGVMAIMSISVTERTREIGVRKALGARRAEILFQFLMEAAFLTSLGGVLGIVLGGGIGWAVHLFSGFPISLPWWSFAIGLGFSAVGRHLFRHVSRHQSLAPRSDRSAALRIGRAPRSSWHEARLVCPELRPCDDSLDACTGSLRLRGLHGAGSR